MNRFIPGFRPIYRNAEGGAGGGAAPAAAASTGQTSATATTSTVGDAATQSQQQSSASATVPSTVGARAPAAPDFKTSLGDYGKEAMFADFKDAQALAKAYKDTKTLVGQKLGIPGDDATPEAKAAFHKAMGVPEAPEGYGFKKPDGLPEGVEYDEKDAAEWAKTFKELNVPSSVANALRDRFVKQYVEGVAKAAEEMKNDKTKSDTNFDEVTKKAFGDKRDAYLEKARADIERYGSKELREMVADMPNAGLALVAQVVTGIRKELGGEDQVITGDSGGSTQSEGEMREELRRVMALPEYNSPFAKGKEAHQKAKDDARNLSQKIAASQASKVKK